MTSSITQIDRYIMLKDSLLQAQEIGNEDDCAVIEREVNKVERDLSRAGFEPKAIYSAVVEFEAASSETARASLQRTGEVGRPVHASTVDTVPLSESVQKLVATAERLERVRDAVHRELWKVYGEVSYAEGHHYSPDDAPLERYGTLIKRFEKVKKIEAEFVRRFGSMDAFKAGRAKAANR